MRLPCPLSALPAIAAELRKFGCHVHFITETFGSVQHSAGKLHWEHDGEYLHVTIVENHGHFPRRLLIGGIRQMVEEAVEAMPRIV